MRALALALASALLVGACTSRPPRHDRSGEVSYNRRELPPSQGLFSGKDGEWTAYRNDVVESEPVRRPAPRRTTTLSCQDGHVCDPPHEDR